MAKSPSVEVETSAQVPQTAADKVARAIAEMQRDTSAVSDKIMSNILDAENADDVFAQTSGEAGSLIPSEGRYGVPLRIVDVGLNPSMFADGPAAYAVITAINLATDQTETIGCGAANVLAGLIKLYQIGALPVDVVLYESPKRTSNGFSITLMRRATENDVQAAKQRHAERF